LLSRFPVAFRLPAFASRVIPFPPGELGLPHGRLTAHRYRRRTPSGLPRSTLTSYDRVGCPFYPGDRRCSPDRMPCPASACRLSAARPNTPPERPTARSHYSRGINEGSRDSPVRSALTRDLHDGTEILRLSPGLRTPPSPAAHAKEGARHRARARDYTTDITPVLPTASPLAKCDLVSQRQISARDHGT